MSGFRTYWVSHDLGETPEAVQIRVQQMAVVVNRAPLMFIALAVNAILTALIARTDENSLFGAVWAGLLTIMATAAFFRWRSRRKQRPPLHVSERGPRRLARAATIQGIIWGAGAAWLIPVEPSPEQAIIGLIIAAMGAGGAMVLATVPAASIGFTIGCVLPLAIRYVSIGDPLYLMLCIMIVLYVAVLLTMARSVYVSFADMIKARVANDALLSELSVARTNLLDAIASTSEGFAQFDVDGHLTVNNDRFARMLGLPAEVAQPGTRFETLLRAGMVPADLLDDMTGYERWIRQTVNEHQSGTNSDVVRFQSGTWIAMNHNRTRKGGVVSTLLDLSALKNRETELSDALVRAETADRAKSEFLALMSHELRTPLNSILGFSELFMIEGFGPHSDPRYKTHAKDIHESGTHLLEIINELLDLSKVEAGQFELQESAIDIPTIVDGAMRMLVERASARKLRLRKDIPDDLPQLTADARVLKQMLINLVGNSIKFSRHEGEVTITARRTDDDGMAIAVTDQGIGVAPEDMHKIMRPFGQVESSLNRAEQEGTGLGLPLVKRMIELHGGHLEFESRVGVGSTATLVFPSARVSTGASEIEVTSPPAS
ncbi:ATP-binding protein [Minwuia sp.]|uniref:sensor histidine kinase n=1 Tax=Minwuia sp. TaxID=2493630 RepID=UPI003A90BC88